MFESIVADIIAKYLGEYIKNLGSEQLKINLFSGNVVLKNLEIKGEALQSLKLPLYVHRGLIGQLNIRIPWTNLKNAPVIVEIDSIAILAGIPLSSNTISYDPVEEQRKLQLEKQKKLDKYELIRTWREGSLSSLQQQQQQQNNNNNGNQNTSSPQSQQEGFISGLLSRILANMQIHINTFHLRYQEVKSNGRVCSLGISFASLKSYTTDKNWGIKSPPTSNTQSSDNVVNDTLYKFIELSDFSVYLNNDDENNLLMDINNNISNEKFLNIFKDLTGTNSKLLNHKYILEPITVTLKVEMNKNLNMDKSIPKLKVQCQFEEVSFQIEENQYQSILKLITTMSNFAQEIKYLKYRPKVRPKQDPRAWWRYFAEVYRVSIREKIQQRSWSFIQKRRSNRKEYVVLFKKLQGVDWIEAIQEKETKRLQEMEVNLSFEDIIYFRSVARRELAVEQEIIDSRKGEFYSSVSRTKGFFSGYLGGWGSKAAADDQKKPFIQLTKEQQEEIYNSMEYDEIASSATIEMPPDYIQNVFQVKIDAIKFTVVGSRVGENPLLKSYLTNITFKMFQRQQGFKIDLDLESFNVIDHYNQSTLFPYIITSTPKYKQQQLKQSPPQQQQLVPSISSPQHLFNIKFETNPINSQYDYALSLILNSLEIIIDKPQIERLIEFATPQETVNLFSISSMAMEEFILLKDMTIFQLREAINHHKTIDLYVDAKAPTIIIPETSNSQDTTLIILDLGNCIMRSDLSKKPIKKQSTMDTHFLLTDQFTKLIDTTSNIIDNPENPSSPTPSTPTTINSDNNNNINQNNSLVATTSSSKHKRSKSSTSNENSLFQISDLYDHYRVEMSSIKVLLAKNNVEWWRSSSTNDLFKYSFPLVEEMAINLHIQSSIEPSELSLALFRISGTLESVKLNISDDSYIQLYKMYQTLANQQSTRNTVTAYNMVIDTIYANSPTNNNNNNNINNNINGNSTATTNTTTTDNQSLIQLSNNDIQLSDTYKRVLARRKLFEADFYLQNVMVDVYFNSSSSSLLSSSSSSTSTTTIEQQKLVQLNIHSLQLSLKKKTYEYNGSFKLVKLSVVDCLLLKQQLDSSVPSQYSSLITSESRKGKSKMLISIDHRVVEKESPDYQQVDSFIDFKFGELNLNYNSITIGKLLSFMDYCLEESFKIQDNLVKVLDLDTSTSNNNKLKLSSSNSLSKSQFINNNNNNNNSKTSIIKAKASISSLSIALIDENNEIGRFSINELVLNDCLIDSKSLQVEGYLNSIMIESFDNQLQPSSFKILTPKNQELNMATFKYKSLFNRPPTLSTSTNSSHINNQFDTEIELNMKSIQLFVIVDFILKTKHILTLPFKTVKYDSLYRYQYQNNNNDQEEEKDNNNSSSDNNETVVEDSLSLTPYSKPKKTNYNIKLESPQIILSSTTGEYFGSKEISIISELGSICVQTQLLEKVEMGTDGKEYMAEWQSILLSLDDMNINTKDHRNNINTILDNLSIQASIDGLIQLVPNHDSNNNYDDQLLDQLIPVQKRTTLSIKEILIQFNDMEHYIIYQVVNDLIEKITFQKQQQKQQIQKIKQNINHHVNSNQSKSNNDHQQQQLEQKNNQIVNSTITVNIETCKLKLMVDRKDFALVRLDQVNLISSTNRMGDSIIDGTIQNAILTDERKPLILYNNIFKVKKSDAVKPMITIRFNPLNRKQLNWDSQLHVDIEPSVIVGSIGFILTLKDFILLPFSPRLTNKDWLDNPWSVEIPSLESDQSSMLSQSMALDRLKLEIKLHSPSIILPLSSGNRNDLYFEMDVDHISVENSFVPVVIAAGNHSAEWESFKVHLNSIELISHSNGQHHTTTTKPFDISVDYSSFDSILTKTIEVLSCVNNQQPSNVHIDISPITLRLNESKYLEFCDMVAQMFRYLDDSPPLQLTKQNIPYYDVLLSRDLKKNNSDSNSSSNVVIRDIFGMFVQLNLSTLQLELLSNQNNDIGFTNVIVEQLSIQVLLPTLSRLVKMSVKGSINSLTVLDTRPTSSKQSKVLTKRDQQQQMMEFNYLSYNKKYITANNLPIVESSQLLFNINVLEALATQSSYLLRVWEYAAINLTSVFGVYQYDKYDPSYNKDTVILDLNSKMKMLVEIINPNLNIFLSNNEGNSSSNVDQGGKGMVIQPKVIRLTNTMRMGQDDVMNIDFDSTSLLLLLNSIPTPLPITKDLDIQIKMEQSLSEQPKLQVYEEDSEEEEEGQTDGNSPKLVQIIHVNFSTQFKLDFNQQKDYELFYRSINQFLEGHYQMDNPEQLQYHRPNQEIKPYDMNTLVKLDSILMNMNDLKVSLHLKSLIFDMSMKYNQFMLLTGTIWNIDLISSNNSIKLIHPLTSNRNNTVSFAYKLNNQPTPDGWDASLECSLWNLEILPSPLSILTDVNSYLLNPINTIPMAKRYNPNQPANSSAKTKLDISLKNSIIRLSNPYRSPTSTTIDGGQSNIKSQDLLITLDRFDISNQIQSKLVYQDKVEYELEVWDYEFSNLLLQIERSFNGNGVEPQLIRLISDLEFKASMQTIRDYDQFMSKSLESFGGDTYDQLLPKLKSIVTIQSIILSLSKDNYKLLIDVYNGLMGNNSNSSTSSSTTTSTTPSTIKFLVDHLISIKMNEFMLSLQDNDGRKLVDISFNDLNSSVNLYKTELGKPLLYDINGSLSYIILNDCREEMKLSKYLQTVHSKNHIYQQQQQQTLQHSLSSSSSTTPILFNEKINIGSQRSNFLGIQPQLDKSIVSFTYQPIELTDGVVNPDQNWKNHLVAHIDSLLLVPNFTLFTNILNYLNNQSEQQPPIPQEPTTTETTLGYNNWLKYELVLTNTQLIIPKLWEGKDYLLLDIDQLQLSNNLYQDQQQSIQDQLMIKFKKMSLSTYMLEEIGYRSRNNILPSVNIDILFKNNYSTQSQQLLGSIIDCNIGSLELMMSVEEYTFMYDVFNRTLNNYYLFKHIQQQQQPTSTTTISTNQPYFNVKSNLQMIKILLMKPSTLLEIDNYGELVVKQLSIDIDLNSDRMVMEGTIKDATIYGPMDIIDKSNFNNSLIIKQSKDLNSDLVTFKYISYSVPIQYQPALPIAQMDMDGLIRDTCYWSSEFYINVKSVNIVSHLGTILKVRDFLFEPLYIPMASPPTRSQKQLDFDQLSVPPNNIKMKLIINMDSWNLLIPTVVNDPQSYRPHTNHTTNIEKEMIIIEFTDGTNIVNRFSKLKNQNNNLDYLVEVLNIRIGKLLLKSKRVDQQLQQQPQQTTNTSQSNNTTSTTTTSTITNSNNNILRSSLSSTSLLQDNTIIQLLSNETSVEIEMEKWFAVDYNYPINPPTSSLGKSTEWLKDHNLYNERMEDQICKIKIPTLELIMSEDDYMFVYYIFTNDWMHFKDINGQVKAPDPPPLPTWCKHKGFRYIAKSHEEEMDIAEGQFSSPNGFINIPPLRNRVTISSLCEIGLISIQIGKSDSILDSIATLSILDVNANYIMYRDGIAKSELLAKDAYLVDQRKNTKCVFKHILTRKDKFKQHQKQQQQQQKEKDLDEFDQDIIGNSSSQQNNNKKPTNSNPPPATPRDSDINYALIFESFVDSNKSRVFTHISFDHPMLFVSPTSINPILSFFTSVYQPSKYNNYNNNLTDIIQSSSNILEQDQPDIQVSKESLPTTTDTQPGQHVRFYLKVTKPKLLFVEDETLQNTRALVMKMPIEFHYSKTPEMNQTMELKALHCQLFRTTPFTDKEGASSTPITNNFALDLVYLYFKENDQTTLHINFQSLNIFVSFKELLFINKILVNLNENIKSINQQQQQLLQQQQQQNNNIIDSNNNSPQTNINDQNNNQNGNRKKSNSISKSKDIVIFKSPTRPEDSGKLMHKTRIHLDFKGRVNFTLLDEHVNLQDIPFLQCTLGDLIADYWGWSEYSFLSTSALLKIENFNQKHMAFDSLVEQFPFNLQILQSDDPKLKVSVKSEGDVNLNISHPFISSLANFYQNVLTTLQQQKQQQDQQQVNSGIKLTNSKEGIKTAIKNNSSFDQYGEDFNDNSSNGSNSGFSNHKNSSSGLYDQENDQDEYKASSSSSPAPTPTISIQDVSGLEELIAMPKGTPPTSPKDTIRWKKQLPSFDNLSTLSSHIVNNMKRDSTRSTVNLSHYNTSDYNLPSSNSTKSTAVSTTSPTTTTNIPPLPPLPLTLPTPTSTLLKHIHRRTLSGSLNSQQLFSTVGQHLFWVVNLTGKPIRYYVEEAQFTNSGTTSSNQNIPHSLSSLDINDNSAIGDRRSIFKPFQSGNQQKPNKMEGREIHYLKDKEKRPLELNSSLFKTRDFRINGSLNVHIALQFTDTGNDNDIKYSPSNDNNEGSGDWIHNVSINQIGDNFYFPPYGNKANLIVCEVGWNENNETKIATLRSPVIVKNNSTVPIDVLMVSNTLDHQVFGPIQVDDNFYVPVDFFNYSSSISIRPSCGYGKSNGSRGGGDYQFDTANQLELVDSSNWPEIHRFVSKKEIITINQQHQQQQPPSTAYTQPSSHDSTSITINDVANGSNNLEFITSLSEFNLSTILQNGIRCEKTGLICTTLLVTPSLIIENALFCDVEIRITSHFELRKSKSPDIQKVINQLDPILLKAGTQTPWYYNAESDVGLLVSIKGLGKNQYFHLHYPSPNSTALDTLANQLTSTIDGHQSISNIGNIVTSTASSINNSRTTQEIPFHCENGYLLLLKIDHRLEGGCHIASIYCTNAIANHTMIPFILKPAKSTVPLTLETNEEPILLSSDKFQLAHPSFPEIPSKEFDIILGKEDIIEIQLHGRDVMKLQFKIVVTTGGVGNPFFRTRKVDIYARYLLVNHLPLTISYTQISKDLVKMSRDSIELKPEDQIPFHWFNGRDEQQLTVTIPQNAEWSWSGGLKLDQVGTNYLKLRNIKDNDIEQTIRVEIIDTNESTIVSFHPNDPQKLPFHIKNESTYQLIFMQKHPGSKKYHLRPGQDLHYTWDHPCHQQLLNVQVEGFNNLSWDINLNKIKQFKPMKLPIQQQHNRSSSSDYSNSSSPSSSSSSSLLRRNIIYPVCQAINGVTRQLVFSHHREESNVLDQIEFAFDISFSKLGLSIINDVPEELIYIQLIDFSYWYSTSNITHTTWLLINDIQIDNQHPDTEYPVLLWCDKKFDRKALPFIEFSSIKLNKDNFDYYDLIALYVNELYIQLDDITLINLHSFYSKLPWDKFSNNNQSTSDINNNSNNNESDNQKNKMFYIKWLIIAEIKLYLTFSISRDGILSNYNKLPALRLLVPSLGKSLGQLENAPLTISQLGIKNVFTNSSTIYDHLHTHYQKQMKRQVHLILGSSNIFGSPVVLFNTISTGMNEAFEEPLRGSIMLMKSILYAAANSSNKLFGTISNGFAVWSMDERYLRRRDQEEKVKAKHIVHGIYLGTKGFVLGVFDGVTGIVVQPIRGAMNDGVFGFLKGIGKGIAGIAVKPVTGVFDFAARTSEGIRNNTNIHPEKFRIRLPRYINPREPIREYTIEECEGNYLLKQNGKNIIARQGYNKLEYKYHLVLPECTILITSASIVCLSKKGIYRWSFPLTEIASVRIPKNPSKCKLNIHLKRPLKIGLIGKKKKIEVLTADYDHIVQLDTKIRSCLFKSYDLDMSSVDNNNDEMDHNYNQQKQQQQITNYNNNNNTTTTNQLKKQLTFK